MWYVTWASDALCSQYSFKLFKCLISLSFITYRLCFLFFSNKNPVKYLWQYWPVLFNNRMTYHLPVYNSRISCQQLCSEVSDSGSKMSSLFLDTSSECLDFIHEITPHCSLAPSETGVLQNGIHLSRTVSETPHTQPIPTTSRFLPPSTYTEPSLTPLHLPGLTPPSLGPLEPRWTHTGLVNLSWVWWNCSDEPSLSMNSGSFARPA